MTKLEEGPRAQNLPREREVRIPAGRVALGGDLVVPDSANGIVLFAQGSGSSRHSPRNRYVAQVLQRTGLATLLMDLLTPDEDALDAQTAALRFDIELLAGRLLEATSRVENQQRMAHLAIGYFGASTGAAAALVARIQPQSLGRIIRREEAGYLRCANQRTRTASERHRS